MEASGRQERDRRCARARRAGARAALPLALALGCAIMPASAAASAAARSKNAAATRAYLIAVEKFDETRLANLPQSVAAVEAAAARISGECPGVLTGAPPHEEVLGFGLAGPGSQPAPSARADGERSRQSRQLGDLKTELSFALDGAQSQPDREATEAFIRALTPLSWSNPRITFLRYLTVAVLQEELDIPVPAVCADMNTWVASGYRTLSPASKALASRSEALLTRVFEIFAVYEQTGLQPFAKLLASYEDASDRALARHTEALAAELKHGNETRTAALKRVETTVGLPATKVTKVKLHVKEPPVIARGRTAAGGKFVVRAERLSRNLRRAGCAVFVTITEPSRPHEGLLELISSGTGRCVSRSHIDPGQTVHCNSGLLTIEADLLPTASSVVLRLSDGRTIISPAIRVPGRLGGPAGLYYQVVRGPSPIPVSLTELDAQGDTVAVLKLPAVVECTKHPVKYFPGGIVRLAHGSLPQGPAFTIRGERYRKLGVVHFELKLEVSSEEPLDSTGQFETGEEAGRAEAGPGRRTPRVFASQTAGGCLPEPHMIVFGLLKAPRDTVLARVSGTLVSLRKVAIPPRLHAGGVLAYGAFSPLPTELLVRNASGRTIAREDISEEARSHTETCEGEAE